MVDVIVQTPLDDDTVNASAYNNVVAKFVDANEKALLDSPQKATMHNLPTKGEITTQLLNSYPAVK